MESEKKNETISYKFLLTIVAAVILILAIISLVLGIVLFGKISSLPPSMQTDKKLPTSLSPAEGKELLPLVRSLTSTMIKVIDALGLDNISTNIKSKTNECFIYESPFGKTFCLSRNTKQFLDARAFCKGMHAQLATESIRNEDERNDLLKKLIGIIGKEYTWIGLEDISEKGNWVYLDGVPATEDNTFWGEEEPNNDEGNEHCGQLWKNIDFQVNDKACSEYAHALCEFNPKKFDFY